MDRHDWLENLVRPSASICVLLILFLVSYIALVTTEQGDLTVLYIPFTILILLPYFISSILALLGIRVSEQRRAIWMKIGMTIIVLTTAPLPFFYEIGGFLIFSFFILIVALIWLLRKRRAGQEVVLSTTGILLSLVIWYLF